MVNNISNKTEDKCLKKHSSSVLIWLMLFICFQNNRLNAQNINKYFTSSIQNKGMLYFVYPQKVSKQNKIILDLTLFSYADSANLNFSLLIPHLIKADTLFIENGNLNLTLIPSNCIVEINGKNYHFRYFNKIHMIDLIKLCHQKQMPSEIYMLHNGEKISLKFKKRKWKKTLSIYEKIMLLREINTINKN